MKFHFGRSWIHGQLYIQFIIQFFNNNFYFLKKSFHFFFKTIEYFHIFFKIFNQILLLENNEFSKKNGWPIEEFLSEDFGAKKNKKTNNIFFKMVAILYTHTNKNKLISIDGCMLIDWQFFNEQWIKSNIVYSRNSNPLKIKHFAMIKHTLCDFHNFLEIFKSSS